MYDTHAPDTGLFKEPVAEITASTLPAMQPIPTRFTANLVFLKRNDLRLPVGKLRATRQQTCCLSYKHLSFQENKGLPQCASGCAVKTHLATCGLQAILTASSAELRCTNSCEGPNRKAFRGASWTDFCDVDSSVAFSRV